MQNPESITVSLEWAKKLQTAGWPHGGYFAWYIYPDLPPDQREPGVEQPHEDLEKHHDKGWKVKLEHYRAPTAEEILQRLPTFVIFNNNGKFGIQCKKNEMNGYNKNVEFMNDSLANATAAMWIYLKENNLLPPTR